MPSKRSYNKPPRFKAGQKVHHWTILQKVSDDFKTTSQTLKKRWRVMCECGTRETLPEYYLIRKGPKLHCGCKTPVSLQTEHKYTWNSWNMLNYRCKKDNHVAWEHYGGRGIKVCDEWAWENPNGFANFLRDMGPRPQGTSIDRYPNNDGNYEPGNCRWATATQQRANQRAYVPFRKKRKPTSQNPETST